MKKSIRLNKEIRNRILCSIMDKYDKKNPLPLQPASEHTWLAEEVHNRLYGHLGDKLAGIPKELLNITGHMRIKVNGTSLGITFPEDEEGNTILRAAPDFYVQATEKEEAKFIEVTKSLRKERLEFDKAVLERLNYSDEVMDVLSSVNTTGQLKELWPEVEEYIPSTLRDPSSIQLPAISVASLNKALS